MGKGREGSWGKRRDRGTSAAKRSDVGLSVVAPNRPVGRTPGVLDAVQQEYAAHSESAGFLMLFHKFRPYPGS